MITSTMNNVAENLINSIQVHNHFQVFCWQFHLFTLFRTCRIEKKRGSPDSDQFHLDTAYRFLHTSTYHWRNLLLLLSGRIHCTPRAG